MSATKFQNPIKETLTLCCLFFLYCNWGFTQTEEQVFTHLAVTDQKKIEKANDLKNQGDIQIETANQLYMETFSVRADIKLKEKEADKKVAQLEAKAQQEQLSALELYRKSNEAKYTVYKGQMESFWKSFSGDEKQYSNARLIEEQSNDYFYQATTIRKAAGREKDRKARIKKLNEAIDLDYLAIDRQLAALGYYLEIGAETPVYLPPAAPVSPVVNQDEPTALSPAQPYLHPTGEPVSTGIVVDATLIEQYKRYLEDSSSVPDGLLTPDILLQLNSFNANQILDIWYAYIYSQPQAEPVQMEMLADPLADKPAEIKEQIQAFDAKTPDDLQVIAEIRSGEESKALLIPADENTIYRVQIAANKAELDQRTLQKMYYGIKNVEMIDEDGWFKYSVGDFPDFKSADIFRKESGVKNAFIVAYRRGTRFVQPTETQQEALAQQLPEKPVQLAGDGLIFRVQVAANRVNMRREQLQRIYNGPYYIEQVEEEGWYKYQLPDVRLFSDALKIIRDVKVDGVFVATYDNGVKIDIYDGVRRSVRAEKEVQVYGRKRVLSDTEYQVQVAASKIPLRSADLAALYTGSHPLALIIEDGWYKYRVKAGFNHEGAKEIRNNCGVAGAFIVSYHIGVKKDK